MTNILSTPDFTLEELNEFVDYVLSYYGPGQIYDKGMTRGDVIEGLNILIEDGGNVYEEFSADSLDREIIGELFDNDYVTPEPIVPGATLSVTLPDGTIKSKVVG